LTHYYIGIAASSEEPSSSLIEKSREFIDSISEYNGLLRIVLGGYWGLMKYIADYSVEKGFDVILVLPEQPRVEPPRRDRFYIIRCELGYRSRSIVLVKTSDLLVCMGGRVGSILEVMLAYSFGKPVIVFRDTGLDTDRLENCFREYIDERRLSRIYYVSSGVEAGGLVANILGLVKHRNMLC